MRVLRELSRWVVLVVGVLLWQLWASGAHSPFFPPPSTILDRMYHLWFSGPASHLFFTSNATGNLLPSIWRTLAGLAGGLIVIALVTPVTPRTWRTIRSTSRRWKSYPTSPARMTQPSSTRACTAPSGICTSQSRMRAIAAAISASSRPIPASSTLISLATALTPSTRSAARTAASFCA